MSYFQLSYTHNLNHRALKIIPWVMVHVCNASTWKIEAGRGGIQGLPGQQESPLSKKTKTKTK